MHKVEIPRENANDDNVTITSIHVENHQEVKTGDILFEFETSKTVIDFKNLLIFFPQILVNLNN